MKLRCVTLHSETRLLTPSSLTKETQNSGSEAQGPSLPEKKKINEYVKKQTKPRKERILPFIIKKLSGKTQGAFHSTKNSGTEISWKRFWIRKLLLFRKANH